MKKTFFSTLFLCLGVSCIYAQELTLVTLSEEEIASKVDTIRVQKVVSDATEEQNNTYVPKSVTLDLKKAVGEIPFTSSVSATGAMTCNVPIEVYPDVHGLLPPLSLSYNQFSDNGLLGVGWQLSGISSINRVPKNNYYDGKVEGIQQNKDDALILDGVRLIKQSATSSRIKYETEQGNIIVNAFLEGGIIKYFEVLYPQGRKGIYGYQYNTANRLQYPLTVLSDLLGHQITYSYESTNNHYRPTCIDYAQSSVVFQYEDRTDKPTIFEAGYNITEDKRLKRIICSYNTNTLQTYELTYQNQTPNVSPLQYLKDSSVLSLIEFFTPETSFNPLRFYYGSNNTTTQYAKTETHLVEYYNFGDRPEQISVVTGKIDPYSNNDGIISFPTKESYQYYYKHSTWFRDAEYKYNNLYSGSEKILIYNGLEYDWDFPYELTTEAGFIDVLCANIDHSNQEKIIKINNYVSGNNDRITFKVYATSSYALVHKYTRTFDLATVLNDGEGNKSIHPKYYFTGDFNGDGKTEILVVSNHNPFGNSSYPTTCYLFDLESNSKLYEGKPFSFVMNYDAADDNYIKKTNYKESDRIVILDYDGDGKSDICLINSAGTHTYRFNITNSNYSLEKIATYEDLKKTDLKNKCLLTGEISGDGKTDLIVSSPITPEGKEPDDLQWSYFYSKGDGSFEAKYGRSAAHEYNAKFCTQDINGDGITDLIFNHGPNNQELTTHINCRNSLFPGTCVVPSAVKHPSSILIPINVVSNGTTYQVACLRNDGLIDKYSFSRNDTHERLLTGIASSHGVVTEINYSQLNTTSHYSGYTATDFPYENFSSPIYLPVTTKRYVNEKLDSYNNYYYSNAIIHKQGLGFCGFTQISQYDNAGNRLIRNYDPFNFGLLKSEESYTNNTLVFSTSYDYTVQVGSNKLKKITLKNKNIQDKLKGTSFSTLYRYDNYGFPVYEEVDYGDGSSRTVSRSYLNNTTESNYLLGFETNASITLYQSGNSRTETGWTVKNQIAEHNGKGLPILKYRYVNGHQVAEERFNYDTKYNLSSQEQRNFNSSTSLICRYEYDIWCRITKITDPTSSSLTYSYDPMYGRLLQKQNHHNQIISYDYDSFGRITTVNYPDGTKQNSNLSWNNTAGLYKMSQTATGQPLAETYYDALGREVRSTSSRFDGKIAQVDKEYDAYGRLHRVSLPYTTVAPLWNRLSYDDFSRLSRIDYASGKQDRYEYEDKKIKTTKNSITSTQVFNNRGNIVEVIDDAGTTIYHWRPDGQPRSILAPGDIETLFEYDQYGRQTAIVDPSAGRKSFTYDAAGNLHTETNANGQTTTINYDTYNRPISKIQPEFTVHYRYDSDSRLLADSINANNYKSYVYDEWGRLEQEKEVANSLWLQKDYTYQQGNPKTKSYTNSSGLIATENYDYTNGYLTEIKLNNETVIWNLLEEDDLGKPTRVQTGPLTRLYAFDQYGIPTGRQSEVMNTGYNFDPYTGNLLSRSDQNRQLQESFNYDHLDRLTNYGNQTVEYDDKGNITNKSDAGVFYYDIEDKPYAQSGADVTTGRKILDGNIIKGGDISLDGNIIKGEETAIVSIETGTLRSSRLDPVVINLPKIQLNDTLKAIPLRDQYIEYTSFDRPKSIEEYYASAWFEYNSNNQRSQMRLSNQNERGSTNLTRTYISNCYEKDILNAVTVAYPGSKIQKKTISSTERLYLGGDVYTAPAVYVKNNSGNWNIYYICRDYLGSITHIVDRDGNMIEENSYDAWGRLRDPDTHKVYNPGEEPDLFLGRGYTGHEHLSEFGLINMNARLYDPATGRFLSPDPYVQNPFFSQHFNRYSYGLNNPFKYTDPSGEVVEYIIAGVIAVAWFYLYKACDNRDRSPYPDGRIPSSGDLRRWAWNPRDWFRSTPGNPNPSGFVVTVGGNIDGSNPYGSIAVGNPNGPMPAIGYSSNQGFGYGYYNNGGTNMYYPGYENKVNQAIEQGVNNAYNNAIQSMAQQQSIENDWSRMVLKKIYNTLPAAQSISVGVDLNAFTYESFVPIELLMIYKGKDAGTIFYNGAVSVGGGLLADVQAVIKMTNYFYIGNQVNNLRAEDFFDWNSGCVSFSIGEGIVAGGGVSWTNLDGNKGYLIGITGEIGVGVGVLPFGVSGGKTITTNYGRTAIW